MIHREQRGAVAILTIDRPERRNAVDHEALAALGAGLAVPDGTRVLVLTGAGGNFCAGADLTGVEDDGFRIMLAEVLTGLRVAPFVTIAAVDGAALGAGTQLALACDLRTATPQARFGIPAAKLGLMVDAWTVRRLASIAGQGPARAMLLAAEILDGDAAVGAGLVQRVASIDAALAWADEIAALAPLTLAGHKLLLNALDGDVSEYETSEAFARAWASADLQEGLAAFHDRRPPVFRGE